MLRFMLFSSPRRGGTVQPRCFPKQPGELRLRQGFEVFAAPPGSNTQPCSIWQEASGSSDSTGANLILWDLGGKLRLEGRGVAPTDMLLPGSNPGLGQTALSGQSLGHPDSRGWGHGCWDVQGAPRAGR